MVGFRVLQGKKGGEGWDVRARVGEEVEREELTHRFLR